MGGIARTKVTADGGNFTPGRGNLYLSRTCFFFFYISHGSLVFLPRRGKTLPTSSLVQQTLDAGHVTPVAPLSRTHLCVWWLSVAQTPASAHDLEDPNFLKRPTAKTFSSIHLATKRQTTCRFFNTGLFSFSRLSVFCFCEIEMPGNIFK